MIDLFILRLKTMMRKPGVMFWALAFPIVLATMFHGMFAGLADAYDIKSLPFAVVSDANWNKVAGADQLVDALSAKETAKETGSTDEHADEGTANGESDALLEPHTVDDIDQAVKLLDAGDAAGYLYANDQGRLSLVLSDDAAVQEGFSQELTISVLNIVLSRFNETGSLVTVLVQNAVKHGADAASVAQAVTAGVEVGMSDFDDSFTRQVSLTHAKPDEASRYFFALLGMACLMTMSFAISAICESQPNLSSLGARCTVGPVPKWKQLGAGFLSAWLMSFICMAVGFLYIRYALGVHVDGREPLALLAVAVATLMASAFGALIGAIPRWSFGVKEGVATAITCILSLFAGLYGQPAVALSDLIASRLPALHAINPAQQVTMLFYDLLYFDDLAPFARTMGMAAALSTVMLCLACVMLRRQRYEQI